MAFVRGALASPGGHDDDVLVLRLSSVLATPPLSGDRRSGSAPAGGDDPPAYFQEAFEAQGSAVSLVLASHLGAAGDPPGAPPTPGAPGRYVLLGRRTGIPSPLAVSAPGVDDDEALAGDVPAAGGQPTADGGPARPVQKAVAQKERAWGLAPIEWRGQLSSSVGGSKSTASPASFSNSDALSLTANSYVWQPWFARVNGNLFLSRSLVSNGESRPVVTTISGGGGVDLFPVSRFPFGASYNVSSNSVSGAALANDVTFQRLSLTQGYRPPTNAYSSNFGYDWSQFSNAQSGVDTINRFSGSFAMAIQSDNPQNINANGSYTVNDNSKTKNGSNYLVLQGTHSLNLIDYGLLLNSDANFNQSSQLSSGVSNQVQSYQAGTSADWIPDDDIPLRVFGNARLYQQTAGATSATTVTLGGNATYTHSRNLRYDANARYFNTAVGGQQFSSVAAGANVAWSGDGYSRTFGPWAYSLGYGATSGLSVTTGAGASAASVFAGGNVGQGLSRAFDIGFGTPVMVSLSQSYGASYAQAIGIAQTLSHSASANWAFSQGADYSVSASLLGNDSRSFGASQSEFQSITANATGNIVLSQFSSASASVNGGLSRQGVSATQVGASAVPAEWIGTASGTVNYQHGRFMRVPGLFYDASYTVNYRPSSSRLLGDLNAAPSGFNLDHIFRQQLRWRVGQLGLTLTNTFTYTGNAQSASIFLFATRDFGGVL